MDTSTPVAHRDNLQDNTPSPSTSPIVNDLSDQPSDSENVLADGRTGASRELDTCLITPTRKLETSEDFEAGANAIMNAAEHTNAFRVERDINPPPVEDSETDADTGEHLVDELNRLLLSESDQAPSPSAELVVQSAQPNDSEAGARDLEINHLNAADDNDLVTVEENHSDDNDLITVEENHSSPSDADLLSGINVDRWSEMKEDITGISSNKITLTPSTTNRENDLIKAPETTPTTPSQNTRRRLIFGEGLTPEQGNARATPNAVQKKRRGDVTESNKVTKKRRIPSVVERLFLNAKAISSPQTGLKTRRRNRTSSLPLPGQRSIRELFIKPTPGAENVENVDASNVNESVHDENNV